LLRYDTIEEFNLNSKAERVAEASASTRNQKQKLGLYYKIEETKTNSTPCP